MASNALFKKSQILASWENVLAASQALLSISGHSDHKSRAIKLWSIIPTGVMPDVRLTQSELDPSPEQLCKALTSFNFLDGQATRYTARYPGLAWADPGLSKAIRELADAKISFKETVASLISVEKYDTAGRMGRARELRKILGLGVDRRLIERKINIISDPVRSIYITWERGHVSHRKVDLAELKKALDSSFISDEEKDERHRKIKELAPWLSTGGTIVERYPVGSAPLYVKVEYQDGQSARMPFSLPLIMTEGCVATESEALGLIGRAQISKIPMLGEPGKENRSDSGRYEHIGFGNLYKKQG